jgi:glycosyltransferase involved in cell wall biosynthesis
MKLTIITPVLNGEAVIERAIRSVRRQRRPSEDWEHLVVDGGSRDRTLQILRRHPHLRWTSELDRGVFDAMNKGIARARGEWIYFLGADDVLHSPRVLERVLPELVEPWDVVYGDVVGPRFAGRYDGPFDGRRLLRRNICHQALFLRRRLFERLGGFDLRYPVNADWEHNLRWFFDPATRARYLDLVVADFADGGLSSDGDRAWRRDRRFTYLRHAHAALPRTRSLALLLREFAKALRTGNLARIGACLALAPRLARGARVSV